MKNTNINRSSSSFPRILPRLRLLIDLPIDKRHGCFKGNDYQIIRSYYGTGGLLYLFICDSGAECGAYLRECEVLD